MKVFALLTLAVGSLLATTSAEAHTQPVAIRTRLTADRLTMVPVPVVALIGPVMSSHPSVSVHPSFSGFHSTPSFHSAPAYHGFSATPSRPFTFRSSSPSVSTRPASTSPTRSYSLSPTRSAPPAEVHHYHTGGGGGGLSATDIILLNSALNSGRQNNYSSAGASQFVPNGGVRATQAAEISDERFSGWQICGVFLVVGGIAYGLYRWLDVD